MVSLILSRKCFERGISAIGFHPPLADGKKDLDWRRWTLNARDLSKQITRRYTAPSTFKDYTWDLGLRSKHFLRLEHYGFIIRWYSAAKMGSLLDMGFSGAQLPAPKGQLCATLRRNNVRQPGALDRLGHCGILESYGWLRCYKTHFGKIHVCLVSY